MEQVSTAAKNALAHILGERCTSCGVRPRMRENKRCGVCDARLCRKIALKDKPEVVDARVIKIVESKYADAVMDDVEPEVLEKLRTRESWQDVFLWGPPGVGKTYTMAAMIRAYTGQGYDCMRSSWDEFCCQIRSTMSPASKMTEWDITERLKSVDMLFIDDLGLRSSVESDFVYQTFFLTLNKRQERLFPTIISSNKNLDRLRESLFDDRIISRLSTALVIEMEGGDRRQRKE